MFYGQFEFYQSPEASPQQWQIPLAEQQRISASSAVPEKRFHYRYLAAELAAQSADWLPHNSQAFAATLCHASTWLINRDPALAQQYYQRYLAQGPYVSWGADIGIRCPAPAFNSAATRASQNLQQEFRQQRWPLLSAGFCSASSCSAAGGGAAAAEIQDWPVAAVTVIFTRVRLQNLVSAIAGLD